MRQLRLTIREAAEAIARQFNAAVVPDWKLRRVVDSLFERDLLDLQRVGPYRTIDADDVPSIAAELESLGWLKRKQQPAAVGE